MDRIWGFDIGTTSVGFAVVEFDEEKSEGRIIHEGVRIFPEGREERKLEPRNQARRAARLLRRQVRRRRLRRKFLREAFAEAGLLPRFNTPEWDISMCPRRPAGGRLLRPGPYELRARGLRERLEPAELGRALYHLCHRRGFLSARRVEERKDLSKAREKEEGKIKGEIKGLEQKLEGRPLGEFLYLASLEKTDRDRLMSEWKVENTYLRNLDKPERIRGRHIGREMVTEEFDRLWETQARFHPDVLTNELKEELQSILLYQRPMFWRLQTVGRCWLEPGEPVCPKGSWLGQQFLMLQHVNNLRVRFMGRPPRPLDPEERKVLLQKLQRQQDMTFAGVSSALKKLWKERGLPGKPEMNLESGGETRLLGNAVEARLAKVFGDAWDSHPMRERLRIELYPRLFAIYNRQVGKKRIELHRKDAFKDEVTPARARFVEEAQRDFSITREQAEQLSEFEPPSGWLRFSEKAIRKLLPFLENGLGLNEKGGALDLAYPGWRSASSHTLDRLPSNPKVMPVLRNPSVNRALNELRKVANNLLRTYGKPTLIRIELLRELKKTKKERLEISSRYSRNRRSREEAKSDLKEKGIPASPEAIEKWLLWKESDEYCPYTGAKISFDALFRRGDFQVEHIFPLSRSLDNNLLNKTLCATDVNKAKGNQTPYEYFRSRPEEWEAIKDRLERWVEKGTFPEEKMKNFLREDYPPGQEFLEDRQRADASYIAVEARKFLARLGVPVEVVNGQVTAQLRSRWGLDAILNPGNPEVKNRSDHRHHAVDALAVALTSLAFVKRLSDYYARGKRGEKPKLPQPWENFFLDAKEKTEAVIVSHRVQRKVSGPLHALTYYGDTGKEETNGGITYRKFVFRKRLKDISKSEIEDIVDPEIRRIVREHAEPYGGDLEKAIAEKGLPVLPDNKTGEKRDIRKVRLWVKQQKRLMVPVWPKAKAGIEPMTFADPAGNHHMAVFRLADGDVHFETVTLFEAARRLRAGEPVVRRTSENGGEFVMSLAPGDALELPAENGAKAYRIVTSVWASGQIVLEDHTEAAGKVWSRPNPASLLRMGARKVRIDPIGRVRPAND
jgi:CRISPR-associated endonuclease Csn1